MTGSSCSTQAICYMGIALGSALGIKLFDSKKEFLLLYGLFLAARCELSQEGVTKSKFKTWNPWKRQFKCTEIVQFLKHLLINFFVCQDLWLKICEVSQNYKRLRFWKFQLSILTNKKVLFLMHCLVQFQCNISLMCSTSCM